MFFTLKKKGPLVVNMTSTVKSTRNRANSLSSNSDMSILRQICIGVSVVLALGAIAASISSVISAENVHNKWNTRNRINPTIPPEPPLRSDLGICGDTNQTHANIIFDGKQWSVRQMCRIRSDPRFFGRGTERRYVPPNTITILSFDLYCDTLVIANNATLITNGFRIIVRSELILNGTISNAGNLDLEYINHTLGTRVPASLIHSSTARLAASNTPNDNVFFDGDRYMVANDDDQVEFSNICYANGLTRPFATVSVNGGGAQHLRNDAQAALFLRDLKNTTYSAGMPGCPGMYVVRVNSTHVDEETFLGGSAAGSIVIAAHSIRLGPNARIDASGGRAKQPTTNALFTNITQFTGLRCRMLTPNTPRRLRQAPGGSGSPGLVAIITSTAINRTRWDTVVSLARPPIASVPAVQWFCNASGYIEQEYESLLYTSDTTSRTDGGLLVIHDVCNVVEELPDDGFDNDLDGVIDGVDVDNDNLLACSRSIQSNCDCNDTNPLGGNILNDVNHCGACNRKCPDETFICRRGQCLPQCGSFQVSSRWLSSSSPVTTAKLLVNNGNVQILLFEFVRTHNSLTSTTNQTLFLTLLPTPSIINLNTASAMIASHNCSGSGVTVQNRTLDAVTYPIQWGAQVNSCRVQVAIQIQPNVTTTPVRLYAASTAVSLAYSLDTNTSQCAPTIIPASPNQTPSITVTIADWLLYVETHSNKL